MTKINFYKEESLIAEFNTDDKKYYVGIKNDTCFIEKYWSDKESSAILPVLKWNTHHLITTVIVKETDEYNIVFRCKNWFEIKLIESELKKELGIKDEECYEEE